MLALLTKRQQNPRPARSSEAPSATPPSSPATAKEEGLPGDCVRSLLPLIVTRLDSPHPRLARRRPVLRGSLQSLVGRATPHAVLGQPLSNGVRFLNRPDVAQSLLNHPAKQRSRVGLAAPYLKTEPP